MLPLSRPHTSFLNAFYCFFLFLSSFSNNITTCYNLNTLLCKNIKPKNSQKNNYNFMQSFNTIKSNVPLSASSWELTAQLNDFALTILVRSASTPTPQGPLVRLSGSHLLDDWMNQHLLLALGTSGCIHSYYLFSIAFINCLSLLLFSSLFLAYPCYLCSTTFSLSVFLLDDHASYE